MRSRTELTRLWLVELRLEELRPSCFREHSCKNMLHNFPDVYIICMDDTRENHQETGEIGHYPF